MGKRRQALSENKVRIGKHDSDRLRAPLPHPTLMHTVKAKVQPPYALYMWCMLAWKCRKSMLSEWGGGGRRRRKKYVTYNRGSKLMAGGCWVCTWGGVCVWEGGGRQ